MMRVDTIDPTKTAMIVVDMQNDFVAPGGGLETPAARAMVPKLAEALQICRSAGIKVIYTTHVHRRDGSDMGLFDMHPPIANRNATVDGTWGVEHVSSTPQASAIANSTDAGSWNPICSSSRPFDTHWIIPHSQIGCSSTPVNSANSRQR